MVANMTVSAATPAHHIDMSEAKERIQQLQRFVREGMLKGLDYGLIPGFLKPFIVQARRSLITIVSRN